MKKPSPEEKIVLKPALQKFSLIFFILIFNTISYGQIPLMGFGKSVETKTDSNFTRLFRLNFNNDEYSDLLLFNSLTKKINVLKGIAGGKFITVQSLNFPFEINRIEPIHLSGNKVNNYAFTSRKSRLFGVLKFSEDGLPIILQTIALNSFPGSLSVNEFNQEGISEFLIAGNSFDGLSIIQLKNQKLIEKKIISKTSFMSAEFADINQDGYKDIVALSSLNRSIRIFYDNSRGEYSETKIIPLNDEPKHFQISDMNFDSFSDIIVSTSKAVNILWGDNNSEFANSVTIKTKNSFDKFSIGDYNRDGNFDLICLSENEGIVTAFFARTDSTFYPGHTMIVENGLKDIIPFYSKFIYGVGLLNSDGKVYLLYSLTSLNENQKLSILPQPEALCEFDYNNNGIKDLAISDKYSNSLVLYLRNSDGFPEFIFPVLLSEPAGSIISFTINESEKGFVCFNYGKRLIELVEIDFKNFSTRKKQIYSDGAIVDLKVKSLNNSLPEIIVLYSKGDALNLQVLTPSNLKFTSVYYPDISKNWQNAEILSTSKLLVSYWKPVKDSLQLIFSDLATKQYTREIKMKVKNNLTQTFSKSLVSENGIDFKFAGMANFQNSTAIIYGDKDLVRYNSIAKELSLRITNKNHLFFSSNNLLFIYNEIARKILQIYLYKPQKSIMYSEIESLPTLTNFIISKLDQRGNALIYTDRSNGVIGINTLFR